MRARPAHTLERTCYVILVLELLLGVAHLVWPEYRWGQGRSSYFNFDNSLTLASWLATLQLFGVSVLAVIAFRREKRAAPTRTRWVWLAGALTAIVLSIAEMTRFPRRLQLLGYPNFDPYEGFVLYAGCWGFLILFGGCLLYRLRRVPGARASGIGWLVAWGLQILLTILRSNPWIADGWDLWVGFLTGLAYLFGCTLLMLAVGKYALQSPWDRSVSASHHDQDRTAPGLPAGSRRILILIGVGAMTFTMIFLQIILFQMLTIFGDYMTAYSAISIALLGIAVGGLLGARAASHSPVESMIGASLLLPISILLAFGATVNMPDSPMATSLLLALPFACGSTVISVVLALARSHLVYCLDLLGAALGALLVSRALGHFREENTLLFLGALTFLLAICFVLGHPERQVRRGLMALTLAGALILSLLGGINIKSDWLNIVRTKILRSYPKAEVLFSRSSFAGRYDVIRREPEHRSLSTYDNGRIIDTIRRRPTEEYQIDPRLPHTLMEKPTILILGLSGDGIIKTAKALAKRVSGVEINPAIVDLQSNELAVFNSNSYEGVDVAIMDGRTYVEQSDEQYDIIALMNAHSARGRTSGRAPSPEYLHTLEAVKSYLSHLTDRGVVIVEEPVSRARREPPVWKLVVTMRRALLEAGSRDPAQHFFIFQWKTRRNNYVQIVMKKHPLADEEIERLKRWLQDVDNRRAIEKRLGRRMGPISCKTTLLYTPDQRLATNYDRIIRGEVDHDFLQARNLQPTTDDRPFHFDVDPSRPESRQAYSRTLIITLLLAPFLLPFLRRHHSELRQAVPYALVVILTGLGYLLVEVVFIQRFEIFLGSPIVTFATVLGTLLLFSGAGSLWSGQIRRRGLYGSLGAIIALLVLHEWWIPTLLPLGASLPMAAKVTAAVVALAPLAFFMGVPFPFVLGAAKTRFTQSSAALLFAINAAASALAVPLTVNLSSSYGFHVVFEIGILLYAIVGLLLVALQRPSLRLLANAAAVVVVGALVISPWVGGRPVADSLSAPDRYRVYAIEYGRSTYSEDKILRGGSSSEPRTFAWLLWVIRGHGKTVLVDTGFDDHDMAKQWRIRDHVAPVAQLAKLGIEPSEVTDVVLTHAHWDHVGGLAPYTDATIWMQEKEYRHALSTVSRSVPHAKGMRWADVELLLEAEAESRLKLINGERELAKGVTMTLGGAHTPGFQYVTVNTLDGPTIIAGDATYLYENNQKHVAVGIAVDYGANLAAIRQMHRSAASPFFILPGHDPRVVSQFPQVADGIVQITAVPE